MVNRGVIPQPYWWNGQWITPPPSTSCGTTYDTVGASETYITPGTASAGIVSA